MPTIYIMFPLFLAFVGKDQRKWFQELASFVMLIMSAASETQPTEKHTREKTHEEVAFVHFLVEKINQIK